MSEERGGGRIVVGVDGSPSGQRALEWATTHAVSTNGTLHIVHCVVPEVLELPATHRLGPHPMDGFRTPEQVLAEAESSARAAAPWVDVRTELAAGAITQQLLDSAETADLIVLGSRGLGGLAGLLSGSVGATVAANAPCPVIVVTQRSLRQSSSPRRGVVVGVDGGGRSAEAVDFAFEVAARRGLALTAILAWSVPFSAYPAGMQSVEETLRDGRQRLTAALQASRERFPAVEVDAKVVRGYPEEVLRRESAEADLVVVGSRRLGGLAGFLRGSVSHGLLRRAGCPVAVVAHGDSVRGVHGGSLQRPDLKRGATAA